MYEFLASLAYSNFSLEIPSSLHSDVHTRFCVQHCTFCIASVYAIKEYNIEQSNTIHKTKRYVFCFLCRFNYLVEIQNSSVIDRKGFVNS